MNLPEKIEIKLITDDDLELENIIVKVKVISGRKNPYYIHFPKTDVNGISILTKNDFIGQFEDHWEFGLMDYNGSIETAKSIVEVSLFNPIPAITNKNLLLWPLTKNEKLKWNSREEAYNYMISCNNTQFECNTLSIDLEKISFIELKIKKKKAIS